MTFLAMIAAKLAAIPTIVLVIAATIAVAAISAYAWYSGHSYGEKSLLGAKIESQEQTAVAVKEQTAITTESLVKYVDRIQYVQGKTRTIIQKVNVYVKDTCALSDDWRVYHDLAASGAVSGPTFKTDGRADSP
jgi:hypothetical protein